MSYSELSTRMQVARQRRAATEILRRFPFEVSELRLAAHAYNTTFRVDTIDGQRFALRINVNSQRSAEQVRAEVSWVEALARDTDLDVPMPQRARDGDIMVLYDHPDVGCVVPAVMYSWLDGPNVGDNLRPVRARALARAMAALHFHAEQWVLPSGAALKLLDKPLMDSPDHLAADHPLLTDERREVIDAVMDRVDNALTGLFARQRNIVIHADLHGGNLKWRRGALSIFDFDDSGIGVPVQDLAISAYYLRDDLAAEECLRASYHEHRGVDASDAEYEAIVAGRNLVLVNGLLAITTAKFRDMLPRYVANSVIKLRRYLESGVYRHEVPGVMPLKP